MSQVCFLEGDKEITWSFFCTQVESVRQTIRQTQFENVLLYHSDSYQFSICFFALAIKQKNKLKMYCFIARAKTYFIAA